MTLPSMSQLQRAMACVSSATLPPVPEEGSTEAAERGSFLHVFLQLAITAFPNADAKAVMAMMAAGDHKEAVERFQSDAMAIDLDAVRGIFRYVRELRIEPAYAVDFAKSAVQFLGYDIGRDYAGKGADRTKQICGSADVTGRDMDKVHRLYDFKTGIHKVTTAADNWQLRALAVAMWYDEGRNEDFQVRAGIIYTNGGVEVDEALWGLAELEDFEFQLEALTKRIQMGFRDEGEGDHCKYCPAFKNCPAKAAMIESPNLFSEVITRTGAAVALNRIKTVRDVLDTVERMIREMADAEPIDMGNGKVYGPSEVVMTEVDPRVAIEVYGDVAKQACSIKLSKSELVKALYADGCTLSEREILSGLAEKGGVFTKTQTRYTERKKR